jgi:hypothetical protein
VKNLEKEGAVQRTAIIQLLSVPPFDLAVPPSSPTGNEIPGAAPSKVPPSVLPPKDHSAPIQEIRSASTALLTGQRLKELKELMQMTFEEHQDISSQLETARPEQKTALGRYESWERGFLFKRVFKSDFALRKANAELSAAKLSELEEQLRLTTIATNPVIQRLSVRRGKRPIKTEVATVASRTIIRFQLHCTALSRSKVRVACGKSFSFQTLTVWFGS